MTDVSDSPDQQTALKQLFALQAAGNGITKMHLGFLIEIVNEEAQLNDFVKQEGTLEFLTQIIELGDEAKEVVTRLLSKDNKLWEILFHGDGSAEQAWALAQSLDLNKILPADGAIKGLLCKGIDTSQQIAEGIWDHIQKRNVITTRVSLLRAQGAIPALLQFIDAKAIWDTIHRQKPNDIRAILSPSENADALLTALRKGGYEDEVKTLEKKNAEILRENADGTANKPDSAP